MPSVSPNLIRAAIMDAGLLAPEINATARRTAIREIASRYACSEDTVERQLKRVKQGAPPRTKRSDRGTSRALSAPALRALHTLCVDPSRAGSSIAQLHQQLASMFPAEGIAYSTVRDQRQRFLDSLPRAVSTPRRIEVARLNQRWEMDLSRMDCFVADPRYCDGYPFRPQLVVCEDARTRCCLYAQYTVTGKAIDVGATLYNAMIPQSDVWPQCGIPEELACDWGSVFKGEYFDTVCSGLGIRINAGHPYYPQDKGKVERFIGTIHNSWENTLVGFTTNDNTGDDAIDPRKFFRQSGHQWIDPRFDQPLLTLDQANLQLQGWIAGTYHRQHHHGIGMAPNVAWMIALRERGRPLEIRPRAFLEQHFLPREVRTVRRGQVALNRLSFYDPALAQFEGQSVELRYTPEDCRAVYVYYDGHRICEAHVAPTFVMGDDACDWSTFNAIRRANETSTALRRQVLRDLNATDLAMLVAEAQQVARPSADGVIPIGAGNAAASAAGMYASRAADAMPLFMQPPIERNPDPGAELDGYEIDGIPLYEPRALAPIGATVAAGGPA